MLIICVITLKRLVKLQSNFPYKVQSQLGKNQYDTNSLGCYIVHMSTWNYCLDSKSITIMGFPLSQSLLYFAVFLQVAHFSTTISFLNSSILSPQKESYPHSLNRLTHCCLSKLKLRSAQLYLVSYKSNVNDIYILAQFHHPPPTDCINETNHNDSELVSLWPCGSVGHFLKLKGPFSGWNSLKTVGTD